MYPMQIIRQLVLFPLAELLGGSHALAGVSDFGGRTYTYPRHLGDCQQVAISGAVLKVYGVGARNEAL